MCVGGGGGKTKQTNQNKATLWKSQGEVRLVNNLDISVVPRKGSKKKASQSDGWQKQCLQSMTFALPVEKGPDKEEKGKSGISGKMAEQGTDNGSNKSQA